MCRDVKRAKGWNIVKENDDKYAYKGDQWISMEDKDTIRAKAEFVRNEKLFGAALYSIDNDDVHNFCGNGAFPLLNEVRSVLTKH